MDRMNIPTALQTVTNVEKIQQREHNNPVIYSLQNSEIDQARHEEQMRQPTEIEQGENRHTVDPDEQKKQQKRRDRRKPDRKNRGKDSGRFIDYSA